MSEKTESEELFERFCTQNQLDWTPYGTAQHPTPDYQISFHDKTVCVEIKQIESTMGFEAEGRQTRTVGDRVRREISKATKQIQAASRDGFPTILLVYNCIDPLQAFGTETHDFIFAMYGELTVRLVEGHVAESYHGRNGKLRGGNTSFSAIGHLRRTALGAEVKLFENVNAKHPLPYDRLPACFGAVRVKVESAA